VGKCDQKTRAFYVNFPSLMYTIPFGLGGVYNGLISHAAGKLNVWQSALVGFTAFVIPLLTAAVLFR
jgi:hypothetical protein